MWGPSRWCGDNRDDTGMRWGWRGRHEDHGDNMGWRPRRQRRLRRPQPWRAHGDLLGLWRWCEDNGDDTGMTWGWWGRCGDNGDNMGTTGTTWGGDHGENGDHSHGDYMGTFWGLWGQCGDNGDDVGTTGTTWGQCGDHGDNEITKNAITFERIKIIEFRLKIWDPWTLPHTCRLQLICRLGGCPIPNCIFIQKMLQWPSKTKFSCFCTGSH